MKFSLFELLAPHYCCSCGEIGEILCQSCYYDIVSEVAVACVVCGQLCTQRGLCDSCTMPYQRAFVVGERTGALKQLINVAKFESTRPACRMQARLLSEVLPQLPDDAVIVPIPTIRRHVRQRGLDHTAHIAQHLAKLRGVRMERPLGRSDHTVQHGASRRERKQQAAAAFHVRGAVNADTTYILLDDVFTTGYTMEYAARTLREAGAEYVWVAVTSRQPHKG